MPYSVYRGDFLRIDREEIRGLGYHSSRIRFEMRCHCATPFPPAKGARRGMPDLHSLLELEASLNVMLYQGPLPMAPITHPRTAAMATDFSTISHEGWKFHIEINIEVDEALRGWNAGVAAGLLCMDRDYHAFYCEVPQSCATPGFRES